LPAYSFIDGNNSRSALLFDDFFQHVAVAAAALVVNRDNGIGRAHFHARAHQAVHAVLHFRVAALGKAIEWLKVMDEWVNGGGGGGNGTHTETYAQTRLGKGC